MLRFGFVAILALHGLIHLLGFVKAYGLGDPDGLTMPITRTAGALWLAAAVLFVAVAVARALQVKWWWMVAIPAVVLSQGLVIAFWADAKLGTLVNVLVLAIAVVGFGSWRFERRVAADVDRLMSGLNLPGHEITADQLRALPKPVARWLRISGAADRRRVSSVQLRQTGRMQTEPGGRWMSFRADQWIATKRPGFVWSAEVDAFPGVSLRGRDSYINGKGAMRIDLLALVPVVNARGANIDQGSLVRYLAEIVWYPTAAVEPYISWQAIDDNSARATMTWQGVQASGVFRFDDMGNVIGFEAKRYKDDTLTDWVLEADPKGYRRLAGMHLPLRWRVSWLMADGKWTWLELTITELYYNGVKLGDGQASLANAPHDLYADIAASR